MALVRIECVTAAGPGPGSWDITDEILAAAPRIGDFEAEAARLRAGARSLGGFAVSRILDFFEAARDNLARTPGPGEAAPPGVAYLRYFLAAANLKRLLESGLNGDIRYLDDFLPFAALGKRVRALPRGLVTHWLAGNVPALGLISLVQGILTKNANVVKLPRRNGLALAALFRDVCWAAPGGARPAGLAPLGEAISESVRLVCCRPDDAPAQAGLSRESDVRVVWGGAGALEAVGRLPRRPGSEDVFFGPGWSLAVIGREALSPAGSGDLADKLATDASVFDQRGCNSAQAVFAESGGAVGPREFARALGEAMARALARFPKGPAGAAEAYAVASVRSEHMLSGDVFSSAGTEWTVIYTESADPPRPRGSRVVFVRPVEDAVAFAGRVPPGVQTVGLALEEPRRTAFARRAAEGGVSRIVPVGSMSGYDHPWDGLFPVERLVRWASLE